MNGHTGGLTLVEVIVSIAIFTVLSMAVLGSMPGILKVNRQTRDDQGVTVAAKAYLESVRAGFTDPAVTVNPATGTQVTAGQTTFDAGTLPAVPESSRMNGYTCTTALEAQLTSPPETGEVTMVRRLTLTCTQTDRPTQTFVADYARPL
ncbi:MULTISPECIES: prepilin-type N-terminal cleavage/methylation domain-containing protein [Deinococcus]|uniref:Type II secretion system protein J n=1 Tax=Deinococcus rufus TaxID=2136097 RepID=A0ABV7ZDB0_9DEIO|nr:prepilin-type N-terminal cleavage/methylation domain-containing protein [Deinococcus sp. AB2017081]WQE96968.1 prepilin-type N-terminal cleavage/methylation domain-containing protein [Deinococcus sp. AB2017081]